MNNTDSENGSSTHSSDEGQICCKENGRERIKLPTLIGSFLPKWNWNSQYFMQHSGYELPFIATFSTLKRWKIRYDDKALDFYSGESEL